ncbi:hypothetical protein MMPV_004399 [Pyropia vietnamensis]
MSTVATAPSAHLATAVPAEAAAKEDVAGLYGVASLRAPKKKGVKKAPTTSAKSTTKMAVKLPSVKKQAAKKTWKKSSQTSAEVKKSGSASKRGPPCNTLKLFLAEYYSISWGLAMMEPNAARAFGIFATARAYAAKYLARHPKTHPMVCGLHPFAIKLRQRGLQIVKDHADRGGKLPPNGKYRTMNQQEKAAMARVLAVPLNKPVPQKLLPKKVPMII